MGLSRRRGAAALLTRAIARAAGLHQVEYYQQLVHALGFPERSRRAARRRAAGRRATPARATLADAGWDGARRRSSRSRRAPRTAARSAGRRNRSRELAAALAADGVQSVMVGSAADAATGAEVASRRRPRRGPCLNLIGRTDLSGARRRPGALPRARDQRLGRDAPGRRRSASASPRCSVRPTTRRRGRSATRTVRARRMPSGAARACCASVRSITAACAASTSAPVLARRGGHAMSGPTGAASFSIATAR